MASELNFSTNRFLPSSLSTSRISRTMSKSLADFALSNGHLQPPVLSSTTQGVRPDGSQSLAQRFELLWHQLKELFNGYASEKAEKLLKQITIFSADFQRLEVLNHDFGPSEPITNEMQHCYLKVLDLYSEFRRMARPSGDMSALDNLMQVNPADHTIVINIPNEAGDLVLETFVLSDQHLDATAQQSAPLLADDVESVPMEFIDRELAEETDSTDPEYLIDESGFEYAERLNAIDHDALVERRADEIFAQQRIQYLNALIQEQQTETNPVNH